MTTRIGLLLFESCDLLDVGGPYEVLLTAARLTVRAGASPAFEVVTVSPDDRPVRAYGGMGLVPSHARAEVGHLDVLVVPGTIDVDTVLADEMVLAAVGELAGRSAVLGSVCTGAFLLAAAGLVGDRPVTTHHEDLHLLAARDDVGEAVTGVRWVDDGDLVTAAGLSSGLAFGLHLVDRFAGRELAVATADQLEHPWDPDGTDVVPRAR